MKRTVLLLILFSSFGLRAQNYYPQAVTVPRTGFMQLIEDNEYVLTLRNNTGEWKPSSRYVNEVAPNIAYTGFSVHSWWEDGTWDDLTMSTDSFVLDNQNRLSVVYSKNMWNYSGQSEKTKAKHVFTYNTSNQLERLEYLEAVNYNSNNYRNTSVTYYKYDPSGNPTLDSNIYYNTSSTETTLSYYSYTGGKISKAIQLRGSDTSRIANYTWDGEHLTSSTGLQYDVTADEWTLTNADTFVYNAAGQIIRHWRLGYVSRNGVITLEPVDNDSYTYTSDGKLLEEIQRQWNNGTWTNYAKTIISYDTNNKPIEGYEYEYVVNDWATAPRVQYLFKIQTGLKSFSNPLSEIVIAPNPANDFITIDLDKDEATIILFDITGKSVYEQAGANDKHTIDVSSLNNGMYYALIQSEGSQRTAKIVVKH